MNILKRFRKSIANVPAAIRKSIKTPHGNMAFTRTEYRKRTHSAGITAKDLEIINRRCPFLAGGINRFSVDLLRAWHGVSNAAPKEVRDKIAEFNRRTWKDYGDYKTHKGVLIEAVRTTLRKGDAFIELVDGSDPEEPFSGELKAMYTVDPDTMGFVLNDDKTGIKWWRQKTGLVGTRDFHPSKIIHLKIYSLEDDVWGIAVGELAYNVAKSLMNSTYAMGETLYRAAHGFPVVNIDGADDELIEDMYDKLEDVSPRTGFVGDENYDFSILNPDALDPENFNKHLYRGLAATLGMPMSMLIGAQKGQVKGSEVDISTYYQYLKSVQDSIFTPILRVVYARVLGRDDFPWRIEWNKIYAGDYAEAEIWFTKVKGVRYLRQEGVITTDEARDVLGFPPVSDIGEEPTPNAAASMDDLIDEMDELQAAPFTDDESATAYAQRMDADEVQAQDERIQQALKQAILRERHIGQKILQAQNGEIGADADQDAAG